MLLAVLLAWLLRLLPTIARRVDGLRADPGFRPALAAGRARSGDARAPSARESGAADRLPLPNPPARAPLRLPAERTVAGRAPPAPAPWAARSRTDRPPAPTRPGRNVP